MGPAAARPAPRKRVRKRKRRAASLSSSSSSSSSDSDSDEDVQPKKVQVAPVAPVPPSEEESSESSSSSSSESEPEHDAEPQPVRRHVSRSPSPPSAAIPSFLQNANATEEELMKAKFRKFWMASVADGFKDDLEEIRKEPTLGTSRLAVLIDGLAAGGDVVREEVM